MELKNPVWLRLESPPNRSSDDVHVHCYLMHDFSIQHMAGLHQYSLTLPVSGRYGGSG